MKKIERIKNAINFKEIEQIPFSFWTHLPGIDLDPTRLANETYDFYKKYDLDFIKTMNNGMYAIEDYGCKIDYSEISKGGVAKLISTPIQNAKDWQKIELCKINRGAIKRELDSLKILIDKVNYEAPIIFTIFSPLTIAYKLSKGEIFNHIKEGFGDSIKKALETITETNINIIKELTNIGVDGIFFAVQTSDYSKTDFETYNIYGRTYDLKLLKAANKMWFNTIHAHGENIMFKVIRDYPINVFNWHAWETLPEIKEAFLATGKTLMSGISRMDITNSNFNEISNQIYNTINITKGKGIIITPGCVIRHPINEKTLNYLRLEIKYWQEKLL